MSDNSIVLRVAAAYVVGVGAFWLLFLLNRTHHWLNSRLFLALAIGLGVAMCLGALSLAAARRRPSP